MRILVTGFDPFGGEQLNSSWEAVRLLPPRVADADLLTAQLPTSFARAPRAARLLLAEHDPEVVVNVGQSGGATGLRLERIAVNLASTDVPDNDGLQPQSATIEPDGPSFYTSTLPLEQMLRALHEQHMPASYSHSAGTFVCNATFYSVAHLHATTSRRRSGFIHVPYLSEQVVDRPCTASMSVGEIVSGLTVALEAVALATSQQ